MTLFPVFIKKIFEAMLFPMLDLVSVQIFESKFEDKANIYNMMPHGVMQFIYEPHLPLSGQSLVYGEVDPG